MKPQDIVKAAGKAKKIIPGFNIPYLPMMEPVVKALKEAGVFGLVMVARLEWVKFEAGGLKAVRDEYERVKDERLTRLHLDHVPVIDEDNLSLDYEAVIHEAIELGYQSVMVDGSRLPLDGNIASTRRIADMAHSAGIPVEAELGAVMGHETGPRMSYEALCASRKGFTSPEEAFRFVRESGCDWLSVAIGNIHGAIAAATKNERKPAARLDIGHLERIRSTIDIPLVLHGGTGISKDYILESIRHGISKINIATAIRQPYERNAVQSIKAGQEAVYQVIVKMLKEDFTSHGKNLLLKPDDLNESL
jgi:fructose-bisphosphate aldolase, class II